MGNPPAAKKPATKAAHAPKALAAELGAFNNQDEITIDWESGNGSQQVNYSTSLIAAAPFMLDALRYAIERYPKLAGSIVEAAISEAENGGK